MLMWLNNGKSTFTMFSEETGLGVEATGGRRVARIYNDRAN